MWGTYLATLCGSLVALIVYGAANPSGAVYASTRVVFKPACHQMVERSFLWGETPFAVCHRCFGIYVGLMIGGTIAAMGFRADAGSKKLWIAATAPMLVHVIALNIFPAVDWWWMRVGTGALFGVWGAWALSLALGQAFETPFPSLRFSRKPLERSQGT